MAQMQAPGKLLNDVGLITRAGRRGKCDLDCGATFALTCEEWQETSKALPMHRNHDGARGDGVELLRKWHILQCQKPCMADTTLQEREGSVLVYHHTRLPTRNEE